MLVFDVKEAMINRARESCDLGRERAQHKLENEGSDKWGLGGEIGFGQMMKGGAGSSRPRSDVSGETRIGLMGTEVRI